MGTMSSFADRAIDKGLPPEFWAVETSVGRSNSLFVEEGTSPQIQSWDLAIAASLILNKNYTLGTLVEYSQDINEQENDFGKGLMSLTKSSGYQSFYNRIKLVPSLSIGAPLSKAAAASSLQGSVGATGTAIVNPDYLISKKLGLSLSVGLRRLFHVYDTSIKGDVNTKFSSTQEFKTSWSFNDKINLTLAFAHIDTLSYQGVSKDFFSHSQFLDISLTPRFSLNFAHAWGVPYASTRKFNGQDLNLSLADEQNSVVSTGFTYVL